MNRIIILGSTGFLGTSLRQKLSNEKLNVKYMVHKKQKNLQKNEFLGDILDKKSLLKIVKDNDVIVNLVGQYSKNLSNFFDININGGLNLIEIAKIKKNIKIVFASSINVYGDNCKDPSKETDVPNPSTSYAIGKFLTEQLYEKYSKLYGIDVTILRFSNLYGKNKKSGLIVNIINSTIKNPVYFSHNGNQQRDFLFVDDAVNGIIQVIKKQPKKFQIFNISSQNKITPKKIAKYIESMSQTPVFYKLKNEKLDEKCICADSTKSNRIFGFSPKITFENGLKNMLEY